MIVIKEIHEFFKNDENIGSCVLMKVGQRTVYGEYQGLIGNGAVAIVTENGTGVKMPVAIWGIDFLSTPLG